MFTFDDVIMYCGDIVGCWINLPEKDTVLSVKCDIRENTYTSDYIFKRILFIISKENSNVHKLV